MAAAPLSGAGRGSGPPLMDYSFLKQVPGALVKPESRRRIQGRKKRQQSKVTKDVRAYVFARERNLCRICRLRPAESMHELRFRSLGGKVSRMNSVAVCGDGVRGCHGFAQRNEISYRFFDDDVSIGAEGDIDFKPLTAAAAEWLKCRVGHVIESPPMVQTEIAS